MRDTRQELDSLRPDFNPEPFQCEGCCTGYTGKFHKTLAVSQRPLILECTQRREASGCRYYLPVVTLPVLFRDLVQARRSSNGEMCALSWKPKTQL
jgi:hypothetical protein